MNVMSATKDLINPVISFRIKEHTQVTSLMNVMFVRRNSKDLMP